MYRIDDRERVSMPPGVAIFEIFSPEIDDIRTLNNRPVGEFSASPLVIAQAQLAGQDMSSTTCHYPDSRNGKPMQFGAFKELLPRWQQILDSLAWLSNEYFEKKKPQQIQAKHIDEISKIAIVMPRFLTARAVNPFRDGELPNIVGDVTKALRGVGGLIERTMDREAIITASEIYVTANQNGSLRGEQGDVCPAPRVLTNEAMEALFSHTNADPKKSELGTIIDDFSQLKQFGVQYREFVSIINACLETRNLPTADLFRLQRLQEDVNTTLQRDVTKSKPLLVQIKEVFGAG